MPGSRGAVQPRAATRWERRATLLALLPVVAFVVSTVPGVRPHGGYSLLLDGLLNNVAYAMAPVISWLRSRRELPGRRRLSHLITVGLAVYGSGNVYWTIFLRPLADQPFPSVADACFLAFYPLAFAALTLLLRRGDERRSASLWLDGLVGGLAVGAVTAAVVVGPIVSTSGGSWAAVATTAAYPLLDLLLLLVIVSTLSVYRWRPPLGLWLLTAGMLLFVLADVQYLFATANGTYESGHLGDGVWVLATVVMGASPAWPSRPTGLRLPTWALLSVPLLATTTALSLLVLDHVHPLHPVAFVLAAATVVLALLRLVVTFREVASLANSRELALTDELTGLGNRRALYDGAPARLRALPGTTGVALLLLDLDRFKEVNDSLGHQAGDAMLRDVAARLRRVLGHKAEYVVRLGGDEFAFLLVGPAADDAEQVAGAVRDALKEPLVLDGITVRVEASIGIASLPAADAELPTLLRQADVAMYHAKTRRLGAFAYAAEQDQFAVDRLEMVEALRSALVDGGIVLHYQPKVDTLTRQVTSVEALVRWQHPTKGLLYPDAFLPLVEDAGLMEQLTGCVLSLALDQVAAWHAQGLRLAAAVNLSASSLVDRRLPSRIGDMLAERDLPAALLEIEITEDFLMADRARAQLILAGLRSRGIRISVDDFGTGYSSLAYLKELPIDELKLDRSFVSGMVVDERSLAIVRSTIGLAHSLGLRLVAEGVEDVETSDELAAAGCDVEQGWLYAKALPAAELETWLAGYSGAVAAPAADAAAAVRP
ncbi:diguanylate cyclase (GGDEF)-like protein [Motilibacter peucedani]|uniref:Diguanylate cyclase (GGDEF)-like protein n=1 Tax=Motilibacter peucedani TaxID=598650 RepID=A0A420XM38_9ACTN|nr:EAL domain-containing protein [Motilibacter peucedani]RKS71381.1 diguanylate cyclase (GGDEF)-like protein [Motilibacter peucedani]